MNDGSEDEVSEATFYKKKKKNYICCDVTKTGFVICKQHPLEKL